MELDDKVDSKVKAKKSHGTDYMRDWLNLENFILELYSNEQDHPDFQMVAKWNGGDPTFLKPISVDTLVFWFRYLLEPKGKVILESRHLKARGVQPPTAANSRKVRPPATFQPGLVHLPLHVPVRRRTPAPRRPRAARVAISRKLPAPPPQFLMKGPRIESLIAPA
jgi:hypothetical protein